MGEKVGGCQGKGNDEYESLVAHHIRNRMFFHSGTKKSDLYDLQSVSVKLEFAHI